MLKDLWFLYYVNLLRKNKIQSQKEKWKLLVKSVKKALVKVRVKRNKTFANSNFQSHITLQPNATLKFFGYKI